MTPFLCTPPEEALTGPREPGAGLGGPESVVEEGKTDLGLWTKTRLTVDRVGQQTYSYASLRRWLRHDDGVPERSAARL